MKIEPTKFMYSLLDLCRFWYSLANNACGGELHVILDDDNIDECFLIEELERIKCIKYDDYEFATLILTGLLLLSEPQRLWITYNIYNVLRNNNLTFEVDDPVD